MAALTVKVVANIMPPCGLLRGACGPARPRPLMVSLRRQYAADQVASVRFKPQLDLE